MSICHVRDAVLPLWLAQCFDLHNISTAAGEGHSDPVGKTTVKTGILDILPFKTMGENPIQSSEGFEGNWAFKT